MTKIPSSPGVAEQVTIYRVVIKDYVRGSRETLNLAGVIEPIGASHPFFDEDCLKEIDAVPVKESAALAHKLDSVVAGDPHL